MPQAAPFCFMPVPPPRPSLRMPAAGAACLPEDTQSTLIWLNGNYYLFLGVQEVGHTGALYDFGHPYRCCAGQAAHMAEHGKVLMANRAAVLLNRYFHK